MSEGMMKGFGKRLFYYLIGFGLGCVLVWAMFYRNGDRPAWMPEGRVLENLADTEINIDSVLTCQLDCYGIPTTFMDEQFWDNATVSFKESDVNRKPCPEYKITGKTTDEVTVIIFIESCEQEKTATLRVVELVNDKGVACACD